MIRSLRAVLAVALGTALALSQVGLVLGAGTTYYVDGKKGSDTNAGTSLNAAFKTVKHALQSRLLTAGTTIEIVGYADYTYFESFDRPVTYPGTSTAPITIRGYRPSSGAFVRPTISGGLTVNKPGSTRWTRPDPANYPDVWRTSWTTTVPGYDSASNGSRFDVVFFDGVNQLRRPVAAPTLADLQSHPGSEYWDGKHLYVRLGLWGGASVDTNPNNHTVTVPTYRGLLINNNSSYFVFRDLRVVHSLGGIQIYTGSHHGRVENVELSYNYVLGLYIQGAHHVVKNVTGARNSFQMFKIDDGATYNVIDHAYAREHPGQGVKITGSGAANNTISYSTFTGGRVVPTWVASYNGEPQGIDIEQGAHDNLVKSNTISQMGRGLMLYQVDSSGKALKGNRIERNMFTDNFRAVVLWDGKSGADGSGAVTFYRNTYVGNGNAIFAPTRTTNKIFKNETIYRTVGGSGTGYNSAVYLQGTGTSISLVNVIVDTTPGYAVYAATGASASVSYTNVYAAALGRSKGSVTWGSGCRTVDPSYLSEDKTSPDYLYITSASTLYGAGTSGTPMGARWK